MTDIKKRSCIRFDTEQGRLGQIAHVTVTQQTNVAIAIRLSPEEVRWLERRLVWERTVTMTALVKELLEGRTSGRSDVSELDKCARR
ncbi:hypothetical protein AB4Z13_31440 [Rhizobium sp. YAF28]|uniref:hypothetical protein n=1 Tax=Rhizobium sp. YAF28 TaxID=3233081 RepID=UPI003F9AA1AF